MWIVSIISGFFFFFQIAEPAMSNSAWTGARPHINESELLCRTGCGYYGNPTWDGHCSKCYKELIQKSQQRKAVFDPTQKIRR